MVEWASPSTVKNWQDTGLAAVAAATMHAVATDAKAQALLAIDRAITSLHAVTVAELLRTVGETATATQVEHGDATGWRNTVYARLERMPEERLRTFASLVDRQPHPAAGHVTDRDLERVRGELHGEILELKRRIESRPVVAANLADGVWRESLPPTWHEAAVLIPTMALARDRLRGVADDIRAELVDSSYGALEVAVAGTLVLRPIAQIVDGLTMVERRAGDWADHRALISQGLIGLELGIRVLHEGDVDGRLTRPAVAAHALACGVFAE